MKDKIVKYLRFLAPGGLKRLFRKYKRRYIRTFRLSREEREPLRLNELEHILRHQLGIGEGDSLIIHSSFGNLNAGFSPEKAVDLLKKIVGKSGNILMPFYPTGHAFYWIQEDHVFDVEKSISCMGILTQAFKESEKVMVSPHPVKALSAWGKDRDFLIGEHHQSLYPYDEHSPYFKISKCPQSKSLGLGVEINSFGHCCEDLFLRDKLEIYSPQSLKGKVKYYDRSFEVETYLHDPQKVNALPSFCSYLKQTNCPSYKSLESKGAPFYSVDHSMVLEHTKELFSKGNSRIKFSKFQGKAAE
ncbi:MAG: AAC(3) family N-acetyltransferase [Cyclobacteriaceae bacterium]